MATTLFLAQDSVNPSQLVYWFNQGFAVVIVLALGWAFYGWIRWAGVNLGLPIAKAHISYLDASTEGIKQATDGIKTVLENHQQHNTKIRQIPTTEGE
jgi:hypothetical protein